MKSPVVLIILCGIFAAMGYTILFAPTYTPTDSTCMSKIVQDQHTQNETHFVRFHVFINGGPWRAPDGDGTGIRVVAREMCDGTVENTTDEKGIAYLWLKPSQRYALSFFNETCTLIAPYDYRRDNDYNIFVRCD
jgi:hypothetical protein